MRMRSMLGNNFIATLSIRGSDFISHWAYEERIFAHAQPAVKCEQFLHVNTCWAYAERISSHPEHTPTKFSAGWAYAEWISSLAEHTRKCLKVEYLGRIKNDFQISRVTGPWDRKVSVSAKKKISCLCTFKAPYHVLVVDIINPVSSLLQISVQLMLLYNKFSWK